MKKIIDRAVLVCAIALVIVSVVTDLPLAQWPLAPITAIVILVNLGWFWYRRKQLPASQMEQLVQKSLRSSKNK